MTTQKNVREVSLKSDLEARLKEVEGSNEVSYDSVIEDYEKQLRERFEKSIARRKEAKLKKLQERGEAYAAVQTRKILIKQLRMEIKELRGAIKDLQAEARELNPRRRKKDGPSKKATKKATK